MPKPFIRPLLALLACTIALASNNIDAWDSEYDPVVVTVPAIRGGAQPILLVRHDAGPGGWQLYSGGDVSHIKPVVMLKKDALKLDASLSALRDLPVGWQATRPNPHAAWKRTKAPPQE